MTRDEYIVRVMQHIDQMHPDNQTDFIVNYGVEHFIDDSANEVLKIVPIRAVPFAEDFSDSRIETVSRGVGRVEVPNGFLRLAEFKMQGWNRSVSHFITPQDSLYHRQSNLATRGGVAKPVVVFDSRHIYYYSLPLDVIPKIEIAKAIVEHPLGEDYPPMLGEGVVLLTAYRLLTANGELERAEIVKGQFQNLISII